MSELILAVGDDDVQLQNLDTCTINIDWSAKKGGKITFGTDQPISLNGPERLGLVLWLPRDKVKAALISASRNTGGDDATDRT